MASLLDKLIDARMVTAIARSRHFGSTVENVLNGKVNIVALSLSSNLDAIRQTTQGTMRPTRATILRNVLIQAVRQVRGSIDIAPVKRVRELVNICMWQRQSVKVLYCVSRKVLYSGGESETEQQW